MPFKPHIIEADEAPLDEQGELLLPADLLSLGGQLSAQASQLAECYPGEDDRAVAPAARSVETAADQAEKTSSQGTRRRRRLAVSAAGLMSLALLGALVTAHFLGLADADSRDQASGRSGELASAAHHEAAANLEITDRAENSLTAPENSKAAGDDGELSPIMFLNQVSAPELEGWYDLNEQQDSEDADLSI